MFSGLSLNRWINISSLEAKRLLECCFAYVLQQLRDDSKILFNIKQNLNNIFITNSHINKKCSEYKIKKTIKKYPRLNRKPKTNIENKFITSRAIQNQIYIMMFVCIAFRIIAS